MNSLVIIMFLTGGLATVSCLSIRKAIARVYQTENWVSAIHPSLTMLTGGYLMEFGMGRDLGLTCDTWLK